MKKEDMPKLNEGKHETLELLKNTEDKVPEPKAAVDLRPSEIPQISAEELEEIRQVIAERRLSGRSEAGIIKRSKDPEELRKERANEWLKSTGFKI